jgi:hypothetical protein
MSNANFLLQECRTSRASLLAEAVAEGLHSLAQPLTAAQWHLEIAAMGGAGTEHHADRMAEALVALEYVSSHVDFLRDIIRPFRIQTEYRSQSLREALFSAIDMQREILEHDAMEVIFREECAEATVMLPLGFAQHIVSCLFTLLRSLAPLCVTFDLTESGQSILLLAAVAYPTEPDRRKTAIPSCSMIRSYVAVLEGDVSVAPDFSSIRIVLPKVN